MLDPTIAEQERRSEVIAAIREAVRLDNRVLLDRAYSGEVCEFRYQFEGEDDLLHLAVTRIRGGPISTAEGQSVAGFLLDGMPPGLVWIRPGEFSQHFYCGHDDLVAHVTA